MNLNPKAFHRVDIDCVGQPTIHIQHCTAAEAANLVATFHETKSDTMQFTWGPENDVVIGGEEAAEKATISFNKTQIVSICVIEEEEEADQ